MKFTSEIQLRPLLCTSAALLLTGCGGGASDANQAPLYAAATVKQGDAAPANPPTPGSSSRNFAIVGYATDPIARQPGTVPAQVTGAPAPSYPDAHNYYVATDGSDSNPGTEDAPFQTILRATKVAVPNTNIFVAPGTYPGGFKTTVSGDSTGRIYYVSTTKWGAKIVPPVKSTNSSAWDNRGDHVQIIGFDVDGSNVQGGVKWRHGIYTGGSYGTIRENHVHDLAQLAPCNGGGGSAIGVDSYYKGKQTDVIGNSVHDIGPAGCRYIQGIYMSTSGSVKNNVVYRISEAAIHLWHDASNVIITNNTVAASNTGIIVGGGNYYYSSDGDDYTAVYNNIVYDNKYGISEQGKTGLHNTYRNNLVYQNTYNWTLKNGLSHSDTVEGAPLFVSYDRAEGTPDFHLTSDSPAIGRGTDAYALRLDFDGNRRDEATGFDIGAYQH